MSTRKALIASALSTAKQALSMPPSDPDHIGDLVWCDPVSGWRGKADVVQQVFKDEGLDPVVLLPQTPDYQVAFSRAILSVRTAIQGLGYTLLSAAPGPAGESRYSVVRVQRGNQVNTQDEATYQCPKDDTRPFVERSPSSSDPKIRGEVEKILQMIGIAIDSHYETYTSDDVRQAFVRQVEMYGGIPCRNSPPHVVYYLTPQAVPHVMKVANVYSKLNWGSVDMFAGSRKNNRSVQAVTRAVNTGLESRLTEFAAEAEKYASNYEGMRPTTIEKRIEEAKALKAQADLYRTVLGAAVEAIDGKIGAVESSLRHTLGLIEGEPQILTQPIASAPASGGVRKAKETTPMDCLKRAEFERTEARMARDRGDDAEAQKHEKRAIAYDLMAETLVA